MKKILLNIFIIIIVFFVFDFLVFSFLRAKYTDSSLRLSLKDYIKLSYSVKKFDRVYKEKFEQRLLDRDSVIDNSSNKKSILIFGCSFGEGDALNQEDRIQSKISELTGRNVYNRSISGLGLQYFPYMLENMNLEKQIYPEPEYIIYIFIDNHIYRLYRYFYDEVLPLLDIRYKYSKGKPNIVPIKHKFIFPYRFIIIRCLMEKYALHKHLEYYGENFNKNFDFIKAHFLLAKDIANKKFPNAKIVILKYEEETNSGIYTTARWKELEDEGFIVLDTLSLTGLHLNQPQYRLDDGYHTNKLAWEMVAPALVKKLNLND